MSSNDSAAVKPRLCHLRKTPDYDGYGFNMQGNIKKPLPNYISKVYEGSPAETAGLKRGDRIIEVNGQNIESKLHKDIVALLMQRCNDVELVVIAPAPGDSLPDLDLPVTESLVAYQHNATPSEDMPRRDIQMTTAMIQAYLAGKKKLD